MKKPKKKLLRKHQLTEPKRRLTKVETSYCEYYRNLDKRFGTDKRSPLHHDSRCPVCNPGNRIND